MNIEELKKSIKIAHDSVKEESEPYKLEAFKIILKEVIRSQILKSSAPPEEKNLNLQGSMTGEIKGKPPQVGFEELATNCHISLDELKNVISINGDSIELLPRDVTFGDSEAKQLVNGSQVVIASYETIFKTEWITSVLLLQSLKGVGINDPHHNLATRLKNRSDIFRKRPNANEYKLTRPGGLNSAYEIIKKLAKGEQLEN